MNGWIAFAHVPGPATDWVTVIVQSGWSSTTGPLKKKVANLIGGPQALV